jgi:lysophospholipase L1-like esterase
MSLITAWVSGIPRNKYSGETVMERLHGGWPVVLLGIALLFSSAISIPVMCSEALRNAYVSTMYRQVAKVARPRFVFVGDSLTANCNWGWALARNPFSAVNLAEDGALIDQVALQITRGSGYAAEFLFVTAGTNDIVLFDRSVEQITERFEHLIEIAPDNLKLVVTLIPYVAAVSPTAKIRGANVEIRRLSAKKAAAVVDLNPLVAPDGALSSKFTTDGLHLNNLGYGIWANELRKILHL